MGKKNLKEGLIEKFIKGFLNDVSKGEVDRAVKKAQSKKLPTPIVDKMKEIDKEIADLKSFLDQYE